MGGGANVTPGDRVEAHGDGLKRGHLLCGEGWWNSFSVLLLHERGLDRMLVDSPYVRARAQVFVARSSAASGTGIS